MSGRTVSTPGPGDRPGALVQEPSHLAVLDVAQFSEPSIVEPSAAEVHGGDGDAVDEPDGRRTAGHGVWVSHADGREGLGGRREVSPDPEGVEQVTPLQGLRPASRHLPVAVAQRGVAGARVLLDGHHVRERWGLQDRLDAAGALRGGGQTLNVEREQGQAPRASSGSWRCVRATQGLAELAHPASECADPFSAMDVAAHGWFFTSCHTDREQCLLLMLRICYAGFVQPMVQRIRIFYNPSFISHRP